MPNQRMRSQRHCDRWRGMCKRQQGLEGLASNGGLMVRERLKKWGIETLLRRKGYKNRERRPDTIKSYQRS